MKERGYNAEQLREKEQGIRGNMRAKSGCDYVASDVSTHVSY
jgi:hypothetical protein